MSKKAAFVVKIERGSFSPNQQHSSHNNSDGGSGALLIWECEPIYKKKPKGNAYNFFRASVEFDGKSQETGAHGNFSTGAQKILPEYTPRLCGLLVNLRKHWYSM